MAAIGPGLRGRVVLDAAGCVVAPGFIDLHSHAQTLAGRRLQACDGVTTALELEAGRAPVDLAYAREERRGSPIHYGFSASWAAARMHVVAGGALDGGAMAIFGGIVGEEWQQAASGPQLVRILDQIANDVAAGAIGIGVIVGYTPGVDPAEYLRGRAAGRRRPVSRPSRTRVTSSSSRRRRSSTAQRSWCAPRGRPARTCTTATSTRRRRVTSTGCSRWSAAASRGRERDHRGVSVRVGIDGDRCRVPRSRAAARAGHPPELISSTRRRMSGYATWSTCTRLRAADPGGLCIVHSLDETTGGGRGGDARLARPRGHHGGQ